VHAAARREPADEVDQRAEAAGGRRDDLGRGLGVEQVGGDQLELRVGVEAFELAIVDVGHDDPPARFEQAARDRAAESAGPAADHRAGVHPHTVVVPRSGLTLQKMLMNRE